MRECIWAGNIFALTIEDTGLQLECYEDSETLSTRDEHRLYKALQNRLETGTSVTIPIERLRELEEKEARLIALENAGVDNWDGFDDAMDEYFRR